MRLLERILRQNPWWEKKRIEEIKDFKKRKSFSQILKYLDAEQIISVVGLRRVGKTTLMLQFIEHLLDSVDPKKILYFSFDEIAARKKEIIEDVLEIYEEQILKEELQDVYIFFDEINHIKDWQVYLKRYYDLNKNIKFFVSGSSSVLLKKAKESLAGRIYEFEMKPLNFEEYLYLKNIEVKDPTIQSLTLKRELNNYLLNGGFPEIINETNFEKVKMYVSSVIDKIIFYDIPKVYAVGEPEILKEMLVVISRNVGMLVNYQTLASSFGITYQTASKYIKYLEKAFLIRLLYNYRGSAIARARKLKKAYLSNTSLAIPFFDSENEFLTATPQMIENAICTHLEARFFFRERREVDFIHNSIPVEVKYQEKPDIKGLVKIAKRLKSSKLIVVTKDEKARKALKSINVDFIPTWLFLLNASI